ncbi:MAG: undecaprenyl-diphosphate phosphatase [bacterium]
MSYIDAIILGIIQGLTEFLPISSSGHLVLAQNLLGVKQPGVSFELVVHLGTLLAVLVYFRWQLIALIKSIFDSTMKEERSIILFLIVGTIPAVIVGLFFKDFFEEAFGSPAFTSAMLIVTGLILFSTKLVKQGNKQVSLITAIIMGIGQAFAILPGISRSGSTIAAGMLFGVYPSKAAEFSFLLAIPAILGAVVLKFSDLLAIDKALIGHYAVGAVFSFIFGLAAVSMLLAIVKKGKLEYFAYYCVAVGSVGLYFLL